ncbi:hypothetical protein [Weissella bombi]|uniref:Uncharacterized protein n=1 Tax=Weissella bombi TaxID=1505725 RepID=A0A1C4C0I6_9LACO|nr:hypothetical protein [Weissella bombi]SCC12657.1 hypothetical protein GA0061074_1199 [Weissella bombi]
MTDKAYIKINQQQECEGGRVKDTINIKTEQLKKLLSEVETSKVAIISGDKKIMQLLYNTIITQGKLINLLIQFNDELKE